RRDRSVEHGRTPGVSLRLGDPSQPLQAERAVALLPQVADRRQAFAMQGARSRILALRLRDLPLSVQYGGDAGSVVDLPRDCQTLLVQRRCPLVVALIAGELPETVKCPEHPKLVLEFPGQCQTCLVEHKGLCVVALNPCDITELTIRIRRPNFVLPIVCDRQEFLK